MLLFTQPGLAGEGNDRTPQALLNKGIITQQEHDQAVQEEERAERSKRKNGSKAEEEKRAKQARLFSTKNGAHRSRLGGFAEFDFIGDNTQSFQGTRRQSPGLGHSNTVNEREQYVTRCTSFSYVLLQIEGVHRLAELEVHVVRDVDDRC